MSALPEEFLVEHVQSRDQKSCGSCWAFAICDVIMSRYRALFKYRLSPQSLIECSGIGCAGTSLLEGLEYAKSEGITLEMNMPYTARDTSEHAPACQLKGKLKIAEYRRLRSVDAIKREIFEHGPVMAKMNVHQSFIGHHYNKDNPNEKPYKPAPGEPIKLLHAVGILGWYSRDGFAVWICYSSWNEYFITYIGDPQIAMEQEVYGITCREQDIITSQEQLAAKAGR